MKAYDSITCEHFCNDFIELMLNVKRLADFANSFSANI